MMENQDPENGLEFQFEKFKPVIERCVELLKKVMKGDPIRFAFDICESELVDRIIKLVFRYYSNAQGTQAPLEITIQVDTLLKSKLKSLDQEDTNPLVSFLKNVCDLPEVSFELSQLTFLGFI